MRPTDAVVLEATTNTWDLYDLVAPLVGRAVVAHAAQVGIIAEIAGVERFDYNEGQAE